MNRALPRPKLPFKLARVSRAVGLLAALALLVVSVPQAEAQCYPLKRFTSRPDGPPGSRLLIDPLPHGWGGELGWLWQSDASSVNNFWGLCPPASWLHESMDGRAYIDGSIGAFDCTWNECPQGSLTLVLETQTPGHTSQQAYLLALRTTESPSGIFDFTCSRPPPFTVVLPFAPFPGVSVSASTIQPPNMFLNLDFDDAAANDHPCPDPVPPTPSTIESYDLLAFYGPADPGRERSNWITVSNVPYLEGGMFRDVMLPCPQQPGESVFLALGVNFNGGVDGAVSTTLVSASTLVGDVDGDGINDCDDSCVDADGDGYGSPGIGGSCLGPDCDDEVGLVYPGAPQVCDGVNNDCVHPGWPNLRGTNEHDDDGDGLSECDGDCDDANPFCDADCTDEDEDGFCVTTDCDDQNGETYPGGPQICDGVNNDCVDPGWPNLQGTNEYDDDGDGLSECEGDCDDTDQNNWDSCATCSDDDEDGLYSGCDAYIDFGGPDNCPEDYNPAQTDDDQDDFGLPCDCDDTDPHTHPDAEEVNDGLDNQCPGDLGHGEIDETSGDSGFHDPQDSTAYSWPAQEGATRYEVGRATQAAFADGCLLNATSGQQVETSWRDEQLPEPGEVLFYVNRPIESHVGSWGADSTGAQRHLSCISHVWAFVDTTEDDVHSSSLYEFFEASHAGPSDYIRVWEYGWGWCAERADFYRESYLQLAQEGGTANSGNWSKWHRNGSSNPWVGPDTASYPNQFGSACWTERPYAWSSERGLLGEYLTLIMNPDDLTFCEVEFIDSGCFATPMQLEVRIAGTYADACDAPVPPKP